MAEQGDPAAQWDDGYALGDTSRSWFQREPALSLRMLDAAGVSAADGLIDVGGGASTLADALLARGFSDVTVLDVSATGMQYGASAPRRLGAAAQLVAWVVADVLTWRPGRRYQVWHDRAVFHFLTTSRAGSSTCAPWTRRPAPTPLRCSAALPRTDPSTAPVSRSPATTRPASPASSAATGR